MRIAIGSGLAGTASLIAGIVIPMMVPQIEPWVGYSLLAAAGVMFLMALALWMPRKQSISPPSNIPTTHGDQSPAIGAIHGNPTFHFGERQPNVKQSNYSLAHIDSLSRVISRGSDSRPRLSASDAWMQKGFEDELERQSQDRKAKWEAERLKAATPQRDAILPDALAFAEFGEWGRSFFEAASSAQNHANEQLERFRQLAHDGNLTVWGKRTESGVFQIIPKEHWLDHNVEWYDLLRGRGRSDKVSGIAPSPYSELMVCKAEFEKEWPVDHGSSEGRVGKRRSLINECRDLAHRYTLDDGGQGFRAFLEGERAYPDIRRHLSPKYLAKMNAQRTSYASADGARYPALVEWFLDELDRLEKEWGLT